jgi:hypothetical protein
MAADRLGRCLGCANIIYRGTSTGKYLGHSKLCENYGTERLDIVRNRKK